MGRTRHAVRLRAAAGGTLLLLLLLLLLLGRLLTSEMPPLLVLLPLVLLSVAGDAEPQRMLGRCSSRKC